MIRQATKNDIDALEQIYRNRVRYNDAHGTHQWSETDVTWNTLSKTYRMEDFYVIEEAGELCAAVCFVDYDPVYWPQMKPKESYYLHKICVDPKHRGKGYADALIEFFKAEGKRLQYSDVRLDVRAQKTKLRAMYERHGFVLVEQRKIFEEYETALYAYTFDK